MTDQPHEPVAPGPEIVPGFSAGLPAPGAVPGAPIVGPPPSQAPAYVQAAPSKRPRRLAAAAVAVLAVGAGAFGVIALSAGDGADSPEAAVEAMFDAIDQEDVIGVLEALDPNERDILRPAVEETGEQAERVEVASKDLDLRKVQGVDLEVDGLTFTTEELGDGVTAVDLTGGTVSSSADLDRMAVGSTVKTLLDQDDAENGGDVDRSASDTIELDGIRLVARRSGGGWHVSVLYSIAEQIRLDEFPGSAPPAFGSGIAAKGAETPEAAVREALDAAVHEDVQRLIELTPPGEMAVLHDYGRILVGAADEPKGDPSIEVSKLELSTADGPDGTKVVSATSYEAVTSDDYGTTTWSYDGTCTTITQTYDEDAYGDYGDEGWTNHGPDGEVVEGSGSGTLEGGGESTSHEYEQCDDETGLVQGGLFLWSYLDGGPGGQVKVVTEQVDGAWYVSPSRSIIESTLGQLRALGADDIRTTARVWNGEYWLAEPDDFWEACGVDRPADSASVEEGEAAADECYQNLPDDYEGGSFYGPGYGYGYEEDFVEVGEEITYEGEDAPSYACYEETDDAAIETCLQDLVDRGEIAPDELAFFRCGAIYDGLPDEASDAEWEVAETAYGDCMDAAFGDGSTTATTAVPAAPTGPTTTAPAVTTTAPTPTTTAPATTAPATATTTIPG